MGETDKTLEGPTHATVVPFVFQFLAVKHTKAARCFAGTLRNEAAVIVKSADFNDEFPMTETGRLSLFNLTIMFRGLVLYMAGVPKDETWEEPGIQGKWKPIKILLGYNMLQYERCNRDGEGSVDEKHAAYVDSYEVVDPAEIPEEDREVVLHRIAVQDAFEKAAAKGETLTLEEAEAAAKAAEKKTGGWFSRRLISCVSPRMLHLRE